MTAKLATLILAASAAFGMSAGYARAAEPTVAGLWEKQSEGKKRLKQFGKVEIPQEAFLEVLKI